MATRRKAEREPLTRERVLAAALALADEHGLEALSMRSLGQRLDVEAMSLYNHVANKDDVVDALLELVTAEIEPASPAGPWRAALRDWALSTNAALRRHPWASPLWMQRTPGPARVRYMEGLLACLHRSPLPAPVAHDAYHVLDTYVVGFTAQQQSFRVTDEELVPLAKAFLAQLPDGESPHVRAHVLEHLHGESGSSFQFGLDLILDGLARTGRSGRRPSAS